MTKKILIIAIGLLLLVAVVGVIILLSRMPATQNPSQGSTYGSNNNNSYAAPAGGGSTTGTSGMTVSSVFGGAISVNNFKADKETYKDPINASAYFLGPHPYEGVADPSAVDNPPYLITYDDKTQSFTISILQEPLKDTRVAMEQFLMAKLGITQTQMCQLKYMVSVPNRVSTIYSGEDLSFSFCPNAVPLP